MMALKTYGTMGVDWEERVDFERLRTQRLARIKRLLKESELGALLCFDMNNVRYITATHIGTWAMDKLARFTLLARDDEPILWDFGSAARHTSSTVPGWARSARVLVSRLSAARCCLPPGVPKRWPARFAWSLRSAACSANR
jgi:hypothetical protein